MLLDEIKKQRVEALKTKNNSTYKILTLILGELSRLDDKSPSDEDVEKVIKKMLNTNTLTKEMVTDQLIKNLTKYQLDQLKTKVLWIKNPPNEENSDGVSEDEIMRLAFEKEL
jgi:hypothetical protein